MKKNFYACLLIISGFYACGGGSSAKENESIASEERKIDGHTVAITAQQFQRAGGASAEPIKYISYTISVDNRGEITDVGYLTALQAETPVEALKLLEINFSKDGEHMQAKVNTKGGYSTYLHFLKKGPGFRLAFREANHDLWANTKLDGFPATSVMVDSIIKGKRQGFLTTRSLAEFSTAVAPQNQPK